MRKEYVEYLKDLPIDIQLANIMEYPFHWQDSIEILFVLKGTITIGVENETFTLVEREIEIINPNEVLSIESKDPDNLVIIIDINQISLSSIMTMQRIHFIIPIHQMIMLRKLKSIMSLENIYQF